MKLKMEILVSATAMITAVAAVVVAIMQTQVMENEAEMEREHQRLSVTPRVFIYTSSHIGDDDGNFVVGFINQGIGPAEIEGLSLHVGDTATNNWDQVISKGTKEKVLISGPKRNVQDVMFNHIIPGMVIPAGDSLVPIKLGTTAENARILRDLGNELVVSVCYCSLYRECWQADNKNARPTQIKQCPASQAIMTGDDTTTDDSVDEKGLPNS